MFNPERLPESESLPDKFHEAVVIGGRLYHGFELTGRFFQQATEEGADQKLIEKMAVKPHNIKNFMRTWERNFTATRAYLEDKDLSLEQVGKTMLGGITRQRVRQIIGKTLTRLRAHSKPETQQLFQMDFPTRKSHAPVRSLVVKMLDQGRGVEEIHQRVGDKRFSYVREKLKREGIKVPYLPESKKARHEEFEQLAARLIRGGDQAQVREDLAKVTLIFINQYREAVMAVRKLAQQAGLHPVVQKGDLQRLIAVLEGDGVSVVQRELIVQNGPQKGVKRYWIIAGCDKEKAIEILKTDPSLEGLHRNPVLVAFGPRPETLPTTTQFIKRDGVSSLGKLIKESGIKFGGYSKLSVEEILDQGCPVPVFYYKEKWIYYLKDQEKLKSYLKQRIRQIRVLVLDI